MIYIDWKKFGMILRRQIDLKGISVTEAAEKIKIGRTRFYDIVSGTVEEQIRRATLDKILRFFEMKEDEIPTINPNIKEKYQSFSTDETVSHIMDILMDFDEDERIGFLAQLEGYQKHKINLKKKPGRRRLTVRGKKKTVA